jgi:hypothetical protein
MVPFNSLYKIESTKKSKAGIYLCDLEPKAPFPKFNIFENKHDTTY